MFKYIPNILSMCRLLLIPTITYSVYEGNYLVALIVFTISSITDIVDGFIARKFNYVTNLGKLLDPLADKLTQISVIASLVIKNIIKSWILYILIVKELLLIIGSAVLYKKKTVVHSKWYGKLATVLLYLAIVCSLVLRYYNISSGIFANMNFALYCLAITCTVFAFFMYVKNSIKNIQNFLTK